MIELLNKPIAGDNSMGVYLKGDRSAYRALRNAFNAAQAAYRQVSETADTLLDNDLREKNEICWKALEELTRQTLVDVSKDLEVYCWHVASTLHSSNPLIQLSQALTALQSLVHESIDDLPSCHSRSLLSGHGEHADHTRAASRVAYHMFPDTMVRIHRSVCF